MRFLFSVIALLLFSTMLKGQCYVKNGSFEGVPAYGTCPANWEVCDYLSTPDIQPGAWNVWQAASKGETYLGLVTRLDDSWETIAQEVIPALQKDECYYFNIDLARSDQYIGYNKAVKLLVWGGSEKCDKKELLVATEVIQHQDWRTYTFTFSPDHDLNYVSLEVYFEGEKPYKGNMLIDELSPFYICENSGLEIDQENVWSIPSFHFNHIPHID